MIYGSKTILPQAGAAPGSAGQTIVESAQVSARLSSTMYYV